MTARNRLGQPDTGLPGKEPQGFKLPPLPLKLVDRAIRILAWVSLCSAVVLLILAAGAQLFLLLDPYQRASKGVAALLETQPSIENNLLTIDIISAKISDHLALYAAESITITNGPAHDERALAAFARWGIPGRDVIVFTGLLDSLASEVLALSQTLQQESLAESLSPLLAETLREGRSDSAALNRLYAQIPAALEQIANQRMRLRTVANGANMIFETPQFKLLLTTLDEVFDSPNALSVPDLFYYALAVHSWVELPALCESLDIQFANTEVVLREVHSVVREARQVADRWGYFGIEPAANWINERIPAIILSSAGLLLSAFASLLWKGRYSLYLPRTTHPGGIISPENWQRWKPFTRLRQIAINRFADFWKSVRERLLTTKTPQQPVASPPVEVSLQIIQTGLPKAVRRLSRERPLRISSDPRDPVYISSARPGAIDIQIRPSRVGFFIEILTSEAPVLLNDQPISGARRLTDGDAIQILDTQLLFQER